MYKNTNLHKYQRFTNNKQFHIFMLLEEYKTKQRNSQSNFKARDQSRKTKPNQK